jgi:hypothetical protein
MACEQEKLKACLTALTAAQERCELVDKAAAQAQALLTESNRIEVRDLKLPVYSLFVELPMQATVEESLQRCSDTLRTGGQGGGAGAGAPHREQQH